MPLAAWIFDRKECRLFLIHSLTPPQAAGEWDQFCGSNEFSRWECNTMKTTRKKKMPEIVLREGKPAAVILDIQEYQEMLEKIEDLDDLKMLKEMRKQPLKFKALDAFLKEFQPGV